MHQRRDFQQELIEIATALEHADMSFKAGRYTDAVPIYKQALMLLEQGYGVNDPDTIACLQKLGDTLYLAGKYNDALPIYQRLLTVGTAVLGDNHPDVIAMKSKVGSTHDMVARGNGQHTAPERAARLSYSSISALRLPQTEGPAGGAASARQAPGQADALRQPAHQSSKGETKDDFRKPALRQREPGPGSNFVAFLIANSSIITSLVVVVALAVWGCITLSKITPQDGATKAPVAVVVASKFKQTAFATADDARSIIMTSANSCKMNAGKDSITVPVVRAGPDWLDFLPVALSCLSKKDVWLEQTPSGLRDEDGIYFYCHDKGSPEYATVDEMRKLGVWAGQMYAGTGIYPREPDSLRDFLNNQGVTGAAASAPTMNIVDKTSPMDRHLFTDPNALADDPDLSQSLPKENLAQWLKEPPLSKGAIHILSVKRIYAPLGSEFYVHGCDREGKLLASSVPGIIYMIALVDGKPFKQQRSSHLPISRSRTLRLCIAKLPPNVTLATVHWVFPGLFLTIGLALGIYSKITRAPSVSGSVAVADLLALILLVLGLFWAYFMIFAP